MSMANAPSTRPALANDHSVDHGHHDMHGKKENLAISERAVKSVDVAKEAKNEYMRNVQELSTRENKVKRESVNQASRLEERLNEVEMGREYHDFLHHQKEVWNRHNLEAQEAEQKIQEEIARLSNALEHALEQMDIMRKDLSQGHADSQQAIARMQRQAMALMHRQQLLKARL